MAKSIKFKNDTYLDSTSITHNKENLKNILTRPILKFNGDFSNTSHFDVKVNIPNNGIYLVCVSYRANQGGYYDNYIETSCDNMWYTRDIRSTWWVGNSICNVIQLNSGIQSVATFGFNKNCSGSWSATLFRLN